MTYRQTDVDRFWLKVKKGEPHECWLWLAGKNGRGYGTFGFSYQNPVGAHRFSYTLTKGQIPDGAEVMHSCDVPACVNPSHLKLGTHSDNMRDMHSKGRANSQNAKKTHCKHGHEYTEANTKYRSNGKWRKCRKCIQITAKFSNPVQFTIPIVHIPTA